MNTTQTLLDEANARYWNEPCGTHLANRTQTADDLRAFDVQYFKKYPFLPCYLDKFEGAVLEIGTGYGTVAQYLAERCLYVGLDIARGPLEILAARNLYGILGNVLNMSYIGLETFDGVVSIGCLHHTGNIPQALAEIHRVLKPGGRLLVMLYNADAERLPVDRNTKGEEAPCIEYTNLSDLPTLFDGWEWFRAQLENGPNKDIYIEAIK